MKFQKTIIKNKNWESRDSGVKIKSDIWFFFSKEL